MHRFLSDPGVLRSLVCSVLFHPSESSNPMHTQQLLPPVDDRSTAALPPLGEFQALNRVCQSHKRCPPIRSLPTIRSLQSRPRRAVHPHRVSASKRPVFARFSFVSSPEVPPLIHEGLGRPAQVSEFFLLSSLVQIPPPGNDIAKLIN